MKCLLESSFVSYNINRYKVCIIKYVFLPLQRIFKHIEGFFKNVVLKNKKLCGKHI